MVYNPPKGPYPCDDTPPSCPQVGHCNHHTRPYRATHSLPLIWVTIICPLPLTWVILHAGHGHITAPWPMSLPTAQPGVQPVLSGCFIICKRSLIVMHQSQPLSKNRMTRSVLSIKKMPHPSDMSLTPCKITSPSSVKTARTLRTDSATPKMILPIFSMQRKSPNIA